MDCRTARLLLDLNRPAGNELDGDEAQALESHLAVCLECSASARAERQFHQQLGRAMCQVAAPPGLKTNILAKLDKDRGDSYRRQMAKNLRIAVGVAACLVVAFLIWNYRHPKRPEIYAQNVHAIAIGQQLERPTKGKVEEWFQQERGVRISAPERFNYNCLVHYDLSPLEGKQVPMMLFVAPGRNTWARVLVVSDTEFNLDSLEDKFKSDSGELTVQVSKPEDGHQAFIIIFTGGDLQPFLEDGAQPAT
jgi:hypothetical protein